jgi:glycosyltransferase involved in cell wall biosynthesis
MTHSIGYSHPLDLHFKSGQTLQVIRDYCHLSKWGYDVTLYGVMTSRADQQEIMRYIEHASVKIITCPFGGKQARSLTKWPFLARMACRRPDYLVTRNWGRLEKILRIKKILGAQTLLIELHEDAFPHLLMDDSEKKATLHKRLVELLLQVDGVILTTPAQEHILTQEFDAYPAYAVLPNGVEFDQWSKAKRHVPDEQKIVPITYCGQFTAWKNIELLFSALKYLPEHFHLRIAGGKNGSDSDTYVNSLADKYGVRGRVDWRGFVAPERLVPEVIDGSGVLLLPLGDNMMSRYFTSPMKLVEYMATSIPVVAVDAPSVRALAGDDTVTLSSCAAEDFAQAVLKAVETLPNDAIFQRMNQRALKYDCKNRAEKMHNFLSQLR